MKSESGGDSMPSIKNWGILGGQGSASDGRGSKTRLSLLERLVWVKYQEFWWPALLYYSYSELQDELYKDMDMVLKAQFAMAILNNNKERKKVKIARLLGRPGLEVVELTAGGYFEFYWQLPNVLSEACKFSTYGNNLELYFDFHKALDQVEELIEDVSQENFALLPGSNSYTWLERANIALSRDGDSSSVGGTRMLDPKSTSPNNHTEQYNIGGGYNSAKQRRRRPTKTSSRSDSIASSVSKDSCLPTMQSTSNAYRSDGHRTTQRSGTTTLSQAVTEVADNRDTTSARPYSNDNNNYYFDADRDQSSDMNYGHEQQQHFGSGFLHDPQHMENPQYQSQRKQGWTWGEGVYQGDSVGGKDETTLSGTKEMRHRNSQYNEDMIPFTDYQGSNPYYEVDGWVPSDASTNRTTHQDVDAVSTTSSMTNRRWSPFHRNIDAKCVGLYHRPNDSVMSSVAYGGGIPRHGAPTSIRDWSDCRDEYNDRVNEDTTASGISFGDRRRPSQYPPHSSLRKARTSTTTHPPGWLNHHPDEVPGHEQTMSSRNRSMPFQPPGLPQDESMVSTMASPGQSIPHWHPPMADGWSAEQGGLPTSGGEDGTVTSFLTSNKLMGDQSLMDTTGSSTDPDGTGNAGASCWPRCMCFSSS